MFPSLVFADAGIVTRTVLERAVILQKMLVPFLLLLAGFRRNSNPKTPAAG